jgi:hypothetical protein
MRQIAKSWSFLGLGGQSEMHAAVFAPAPHGARNMHI